MMMMMINHGQVNYNVMRGRLAITPPSCIHFINFFSEGLKTFMMMTMMMIIIIIMIIIMIMMINHEQGNCNLSCVEGLLLPLHHAFILLTFY